MDWERKLAVASFVLALGALGMASAAWFETIRTTEYLEEQLAIARAKEEAASEAKPNQPVVQQAPGLSTAAEPSEIPSVTVDKPRPAVPVGPSEADLLALGEQLARLRDGKPLGRPATRVPAGSASVGGQSTVLPELQDAPPIERKPDKWALAAARRRVGITMYATQWCGVCRKARTYMKKNGISFTERDVEASESASRRHLEINPGGTVPTFDIDGTVLVGFSEPRFEGLLDQAARSKL